VLQRKLTMLVGSFRRPHLRQHMLSISNGDEQQMKTINLQFVQRIALVSVLAILVACAWLTPLDSAANQQVDAGLRRALITFATARALNAVISVIQGTEVAVEPAGVGVVFTPGQVLDPVNDLVEQFSGLMLIASISFGMQKVLLSIGAYWMVSMLLSIAALGWAFCYLRQRSVPSLMAKIFVILLMTRFAVPVVTIGTDMLFQQFMATDYQSSHQVIDSASGNLAKLAPQVAVPDENQGMLDRLKGWWSQNGDVKARFDNLKQAAERATEHIINLMVIFLLQTLVIPLLLLWVLYGVARGTFELPNKRPN